MAAAYNDSTSSKWRNTDRTETPDRSAICEGPGSLDALREQLEDRRHHGLAVALATRTPAVHPGGIAGRGVTGRAGSVDDDPAGAPLGLGLALGARIRTGGGSHPVQTRGTGGGPLTQTPEIMSR